MHTSDASIAGARPEGTMDGEHRVQVGLMTALRDAVREDRPASEIEEILEQLRDYTDVHFASEQLLMRLYNYPRYHDHAREHANMVGQVDEILDAYRTGDRHLLVDRVDALIAWLTGHIGRTDKAFGRYLEGLGAGR